MTLELIPGYDVRKAAQVAAYFALKQGGAINVLKLSKLLYLAERECMAQYDEPMFYDDLASMPDGPVVSITLNLINGEVEHAAWSAFIEDRSGRDIRHRPGIDINALDELSRADIAVIEALWGRFGTWDRFKLRDWTHKAENIPEWKNPHGSSIPISHEEVLGYLKKPRVDVLIQDIEDRRAIAQRLDAASQ